MAPPDPRRAHLARQLLGTHIDATVEEINTAYWRLLRRIHPDTATPGTPPTVTPAEAQAARDLLRTLAQTTPQHDPRPTQHRVHELRPPVRSRQNLDIHAGPVRYHGPASGGWRP